MNDLAAERAELQRKLDWLGVKSTGYERIENRIREIDREIGQAHTRFKPPDRHAETFGRHDRVNGAEKIESAYIGRGGA